MIGLTNRELWIFLIAIVAIIFGPVNAWAETAKGPQALDPLWSQIGHGLGALIAGALAALASVMVKHLEERKLIREETAREYDARISSASDQVVVAVEAWALRQGRKVNAEEKLKEGIRRLLRRFKFLDHEEAEEHVEESLLPLNLGPAKPAISDPESTGPEPSLIE